MVQNERNGDFYIVQMRTVFFGNFSNVFSLDWLQLPQTGMQYDK